MDEQEAEALRAELTGMLRGAFRPVLLPHPLLRVHGRLHLEDTRREVMRQLAGVGWGACVPGGADNAVWMAKLCWDTGRVFGTGDKESGYPQADLVADFRAICQYVPALRRPFLLHFGGGADLYDRVP